MGIKLYLTPAPPWVTWSRWIAGGVNLLHDVGGGFLVYLLAAGSLQDADQWGQYDWQVVSQVALTSAGAILAVVATWAPRLLGNRLRALGLFLAAAATLLAAALGWGYWLAMGSKIAFGTIVALSVTFVVAYGFHAGCLLWLERKHLDN